MLFKTLLFILQLLARVIVCRLFSFLVVILERFLTVLSVNDSNIVCGRYEKFQLVLPFKIIFTAVQRKSLILLLKR